MVALRIAYRALAVGDMDLTGYINEAEAAEIKREIGEAAQCFDMLAHVCNAGYQAIDNATN